ncbi:MAG: matrixin family metalloprotease [Kofleriaceae bacterium]|nr:matrixin family metalloprotease [Kofleriaceae bacterium]
MHRTGGRVVAGDYDDSRRWVSHTVQTTGRKDAVMPGFEGSDAEWRGMLSCARNEYAGLPVDFVEKPPANGEYLLVFVGGSPTNMGMSRMWGWASAGSKEVVPHGVGFVFSADHKAKDRTIALCETLAHEVGHMIGLDHSTDCNDVMSTNAACRNRDYKHGRIRGFQSPNLAILASSLATWGRSAQDPTTRLADDAADKTQKVRANVPQQQKTPPAR